MKQFLFITLCTAVVVVGGLVASTAVTHAATTFSSPFQLHGWAWSDTIGWVSFNSADSGAGGKTYNVTVSAPSPSNPAYGSGTSALTGYAWSDKVGWIQFGGLSGCPGGGSCAATLHFSNNKLTGWARALNYGNGWDGWISLNCSNTSACGTSNYRIKATPNGSQGAFDSSSYAWGDTVVGWTNFSYTTFTPPCAYVQKCTADSLGITTNNMWCQSTTTSCDSISSGSTCNSVSGTPQCTGSALSGQLIITPTYVAQGGTVNMSWNMAASAQDCYITQNDVVSSNAPKNGPGVVGNNVASDPVTDHTTTFRLYCQPNGGGSYALVDSVLVQLLPTIQEN